MKKLPWMKKPRIGKTAAGNKPRILFKILPAWTWKRKNWNWNDPMGLVNPSQDGARRGTAWNWNGMALSSVHWLVDSLSIERNKDYKCNSRDAPTSCVTFSSINVGLPMHAIHQLPGATLWLVNNVTHNHKWCHLCCKHTPLITLWSQTCVDIATRASMNWKGYASHHRCPMWCQAWEMTYLSRHTSLSLSSR